MTDLIKVGISSCLLGNPVRYDGGHQHDRFLTDTLGQYVEYVPVCPESETGLGTPREAMRLVGDPADPHLITRTTKLDHTDRMRQWAAKRLEQLAEEDLCGFIFKSRSPSSGMERVKVYDTDGKTIGMASGIFARMFMARFPLIPVEDEGRLHDPQLRENFIERIFVWRRWRALNTGKISIGRLVEFHTDHKLLILAHSPAIYREMGKLVADAKKQNVADVYRLYAEKLSEALRLKTTPRKNANVLEHMLGYFKKQLSADEKAEMLETIRLYQDGVTPLIVPITLLRHYIRKYEEPYLGRQAYVNPHPIELKLRNHA